MVPLNLVLIAGGVILSAVLTGAFFLRIYIASLNGDIDARDQTIIQMNEAYIAEHTAKANCDANVVTLHAAIDESNAEVERWRKKPPDVKVVTVTQVVEKLKIVRSDDNVSEEECYETHSVLEAVRGAGL
ncbi:hypothetical protein ACM66T_10290 [Sulfurimonas sp. ST-25]